MSGHFDDLLSGLVESAAGAAREPGAGVARKRGRQRRNRQRVAASTLSLALLGVVGGVAAVTVHGGTNGVPAAPATGTHSAVPVTPSPYNPSPTTTPSNTPTGTTVTPGSTGSTGSTASTPPTGTLGSNAGKSPASCTNAELSAAFGHGATNGDYQSTDVIFTNIGTITCTLQGYPGAAIATSSTTINATRELNEYMGDTHLNTPPLVTLAPGGTASATLQWLLPTAGQTCKYPTTTGSIEVTAPDTTHLNTLDTGAHLGKNGICSGFQIDPVTPGTAKPLT